MSSIIVMKQRDSIHLITDGASYTSDGIVVAFGTKVGVMPRLNAAVYTRGPAMMATLAACEMERQFASFEEMIDRLEEYASEFYGRNEERVRSTGQPELEMYVVGWCAERSRPEGYLIRCSFADSDFSERLPPGTYQAPANKLQVLGVLCGAPSVTPPEMATAKFPSHLVVDEMDPSVDGLHLFQIQRGKLGERTDQEPFYSIGGFAMLTSIFESEIRQRILSRFDDKVGELIRPEPVQDWAAWRDAIGRGTRSAIPFGSRLKRDIARRKEGKKR